MALPLPLQVCEIQRQTPTVSSLRMRPLAGHPREPFLAGQVAILEIEGAGSSYLAFAGAPEDVDYEFLIKRTASTNFLVELFRREREGEFPTLLLRGIVGPGFPVTGNPGQDLVLVAMGTGLAPLRSTLRHLLADRQAYGRVIVLYGARSRDEFCYQEEMTTEWQRHGVELRQVISRPDEREWSGPTGYVQSLLDNLVPTLSQPLALICGSLEMIEQTRKRLLELGFPAERIRTNF
jgi:NAD(P)H-flavin reductase